MKIIIVNGPNLNLLEKREPSIYGGQSFDTYFKFLQSDFNKIHLEYYQSNIEGDIIDKLQSIGGMDSIVPSEGLVFKYKGNTYKFTGAFAPINQITGLISF